MSRRIFSRIFSPDFFSSFLGKKVPRKIHSENPRENPPKFIQQKSSDTFLQIGRGKFSRMQRLADWILSSTELEAFLQTPAPVLNNISGPMGARFFIQYWARVWQPHNRVFLDLGFGGTHVLHPGFSWCSSCPCFPYFP